MKSRKTAVAREDYAAERRRQVEKTAQIARTGRPHNGGTVYLATALYCLYLTRHSTAIDKPDAA